jgi:hypothetical protein
MPDGTLAFIYPVPGQPGIWPTPPEAGGGRPTHPIAGGGGHPSHPIELPPIPPGLEPSHPIVLPPDGIEPSHPIFIPIVPTQPLPPTPGIPPTPTPPIAAPPGTVWPPLPPSTGIAGKALVLVWVVGVGYRWLVLEGPAIWPPTAQPK